MKNIPFWLDNRPFYTSVNFPPKIIDVAIIGGDLYGLATMYWISNLCDLNCVLLSKTHIGTRNSCRSIGAINTIPDGSINIHGSKNFLQRVKLAYENRDLLIDFLLQHEMCGAIRNGGIQVATTDSGMAQIELIQRNLSENNYVCESLSSKEIETLTGGRGFAGGIYHPAEFLIDPYCLLYLMAGICEQKGSNSIIEQINVIAIEEKDGYVELITDTGGTLKADKVIICNNELASQIDSDLLEVFIRNGIQKSQTITTERVKKIDHITQLSCRSVTGNNGWALQDDRFLHVVRNKPFKSLDYYKYNGSYLEESSMFLGKYFGSLLKSAKRAFVWNDYYVNQENLMPIVEHKTANIIYNVGYDYSFMDTFFAAARRIAMALNENKSINLN